MQYGAKARELHDTVERRAEELAGEQRALREDRVAHEAEEAREMARRAVSCDSNLRMACRDLTVDALDSAGYILVEDVVECAERGHWASSRYRLLRRPHTFVGRCRSAALGAARGTGVGGRLVDAGAFVLNKGRDAGRGWEGRRRGDTGGGYMGGYG